MSKIKADVNNILTYLAGGILGIMAALVILQLIHSLADNSDHTFIRHWLKEQSPLYALTMIASASAVGILTTKRRLDKNELRYEKNKNQELEEISQAKTEAISFTSHELRTPIASIKWSVKSLPDQDFGPLNPEQKKLLNEIYLINENLQSLLADFLDSSKLDIGKLEMHLKNLSLKELEKEIGQLVSKKQTLLKSKNIRLQFNSLINNSSPLQALIDLNRIGQVINNLLENAVSYTPAGGLIEVNLANNKNDFLFTIKDSGIGIPAKERGKVFVKFFRATNARKLRSSGTGLGLYLCKKFVLSHHGKIWFEAGRAGGSVFSFTLPLKAKQATEELFRKI